MARPDTDPLLNHKLAQPDGNKLAFTDDRKSSPLVGSQALPGQAGPSPNPGVTSPSGATAGACPDKSCSCGGCGPSCTGDCCDACTMGDDLDRRRTMPLPGAAAFDPDLLQEMAANHPDGQIRAGAKQLLASHHKASPLIDRSANRVRPPSKPPSTQPLTATGARGVGQQDVAPSSGVDSMDIPHVHRHEGTAEKVRAYFHAHPHSHAVAHDPDDPNDVVDHDRRDHLSDPRHQAALRGFGGWESKSAGTSPADAIKAVQADSEKVQKLDTDRGIPLHWISDRLAENAAAIRQLSMSAELAELRKAAAPVDARILQLVEEQKELRAIQANAAGITTKAAQRHGVSAAALQRAARAKMHKNARAIRAIAGGEVDWSGRLIRKTATANVRKAVAVDSFAMTPELAKMIRGAVTKAFEDLDGRINALNERADGSRKRL
jgi:hypothetical protein